MGYYLTIDTGTTNTRCCILDENGSFLAMEKRPVGVRNTAIEGSLDHLKATLKECLEALLEKTNLTYQDISKVLAGGMITSNLGLLEIPHCIAPAGKLDLAKASITKAFPEICPLPITFIPGVKNLATGVDLQNFESMDMMRGEEVEAIALSEELPQGQPCLLVLPGSHTKFVAMDAQGRMTGCLTTIGGELLSAIVNDSIIADSVGHRFIEAGEYDKELFLCGYRTAQKVGVARACFSGRILKLFAEPDEGKIGSYIAGAALQGDLQALRESSALQTTQDTTVIVSGKEPLCTMLRDLIEADGYFREVRISQLSGNMPLSARGAYLVSQYI